MSSAADATLNAFDCATDRMARAFLSLLSREIEGHNQLLLEAREKEQDIEPDEADVLLGVDHRTLSPERQTLRGGVCAMAVILARQLESAPGLIARLRHQAPKVCIKTLRQDDVDLVVEVLAQTVFGMRSGQINPTTRSHFSGFAIFGSSELTKARIKPWVVRDARHVTLPIVLVSSDPEFEVEPDVWRAFSYTLELPKIDLACLNFVISLVCGTPSQVKLDPTILQKITYEDCDDAILPGRSISECLAALIAAVKQRCDLPSTGPFLEDLAGYGDAKAWGRGVIADLEAMSKGELKWCDFPNRMILLCGVPGTGKTTFAAALAQSAGVPLITSSVADWNAAEYLSGTLSALSATFARARASSPCILLIDEMDGMSSRSRLSGANAPYWQQIVNFLLQKLDAANQTDGLVVVGTTNLPDMIDPALRRSGRMDRTIEIPLPGLEDLAAIFASYLDRQFDEKTMLSFARLALGKTGADCEVLIRHARSSARREGRAVSPTDVLREIKGVSAFASPDLRRRMAVHEAGHAVVSLVLAYASVELISIAGKDGFTQLGTPNGVYTADCARDQLAVLLGGRAAEELVYGSVSGGSGGSERSDLAEATRVATAMELQFGFGEFWLPFIDASLASLQNWPGVSSAVRRQLDDAMAKASLLLIENRELLERMAAALFKDSVLLQADIRRIEQARGRTFAATVS